MIIVKHPSLTVEDWSEYDLGSLPPLLLPKRSWQATAMVDIDSPLQDPTSYTSDRQTRSRDAWLDQVLHCSCGCCGCLARHDRMIWMIHDSRIFKNHQLLKGTLRWIPKDVSPNHKDPSDSSTDTWPPQPKGWIHSTFWKVGKSFILPGVCICIIPSVLAMMRENLNVIFLGGLPYQTT